MGDNFTLRRNNNNNNDFGVTRKKWHSFLSLILLVE